MDESEPGRGQSWGVEADGRGDTPGDRMLGPQGGRRHWRQSTITEPGLDNRGNIFFAAVEMTRMPMILADPNQDDCPIVFANNAFLDLTGYEEAEIIGRNCRFLQGAATDRATVAQLREALQTRQAIAVEILNYRRDGSPFWNAVFMGPVYDPQGELLYYFASQLNVTERRESEQAYRQAQKMEAIGQLTAGLAHDFNNLLHVISGSLERIASRPNDPAARDRYVAAAVTAAERGAKLTRQLLAFARRTRLEPKGVDLSDLIGGISELLESSVGSKADLQLNLRRRLPDVRVDPTHLEMALINIVVNARDASANGGLITISTGVQTLGGDTAVPGLKGGDYVVLSIADEGAGMPPHVKARATEPFFTTKPVGEGTGLGLAMAQGFVQQSGGRLEIESEPGKGSTVRLYFPQWTGEAEIIEPAPQGRQRLVDNPSAPPLVLVVDDNAEVASLAEDILSEIGYRVVVAHSAEEALKRFDEAVGQGGAFSLVFSDIVMPGGMNGLVLAEEIRKRSPATPVLLSTGYNDELALEGPRDPDLDVLGKPYRRSELIDRVQAALRRAVGTGPERYKSDFGVATA